jgi:hypothetical protein
VVQKPFKIGLWEESESLKIQARESLQCCKQSLIGDSNRSSEDQNVDRNVDSKDCLQSFTWEQGLYWELDQRLF